ncbi:RNA polymerase sigma factor [Pedobacter sp. D749]|uniref:RNA polymerase sigma factor n=1 Tax=Pedobacter sp. D749 TaxID=2856523 RepID=UPI001C56834D|nr:sigma factor [Pedobacter sp. D749]QXU43473.1 hypothetical protein KYH19_07785 [Pedobacter sp. D749]
MDLYPRQTDQQLLSQLSAGDERAYAAIYERYKFLLFSFALRRLGDGQESEDLLHEVFLSL